jgi:hypothetical protein
LAQARRLVSHLVFRDLQLRPHVVHARSMA